MKLNEKKRDAHQILVLKMYFTTEFPLFAQTIGLKCVKVELVQFSQCPFGNRLFICLSIQLHFVYQQEKFD